MKLRLRTNSVRFRLTQSEVTRLYQHGVVGEVVDFGDGEVLAYRLETRTPPGPPRAVFREGTVAVSVSTGEAEAWATSDDIGIYAQSGAVAISIEKDFQCLEGPSNLDHDALPHPGEPPKLTST